MKRIAFLLAMVLSVMSISQQANAQIFKRIKDEVQRRVENQVTNDAGQAVDKAIDKVEDAVSDTVKGEDKEETDNNNDDGSVTQQTNPDPVSKPDSDSPKPKHHPTLAAYKNYDFVPGDKVIFQSDFIHQQDAELPARLGTYKGTAEVQTYKDNKVLVLEKESDVSLMPVMGNDNYLPEQFTIEFDILFNGPLPNGYHRVAIEFAKSDVPKKDLKYYHNGTYYFSMTNVEKVKFGEDPIGRDLPKKLVQSLAVPNTWHHVAVYIHNNIGKAYIDQYRVAASNIMPTGITKLAINTYDPGREIMIKNLRIAAGGSDAYQKIISDGKLVTHGIHFAFGKADILPESMGTINEMYDVLKNHPDLKLEIVGYTDNVGSDEANLKLSQQRAAAVKAQLVRMGIEASFLTTKGLGEQSPIAGNDTPEGRANNRRVEFVKK